METEFKRIVKGTAPRKTVDKKQNGSSLIDRSTFMATSAFRSSDGAWCRLKRFAAGSSYPSSRPTIRRALILVVLSLLPVSNSTRALAQNKPATPDLLDKSLEDLMSIEVDSVYGASGFKQKITE